MRNYKNSKMMLVVFVIIPLLFPKHHRSRQLCQGMVQQEAHLVIFPSLELWHKFESSSCFLQIRFFLLKYLRLTFRHIELLSTLRQHRRLTIWK